MVTLLHVSLGLPPGLEAPVMTPNGVIFLACQLTYKWDSC